MTLQQFESKKIYLLFSFQRLHHQLQRFGKSDGCRYARHVGVDHNHLFCTHGLQIGKLFPSLFFLPVDIAHGDDKNHRRIFQQHGFAGDGTGRHTFGNVPATGQRDIIVQKSIGNDGKQRIHTQLDKNLSSIGFTRFHPVDALLYRLQHFVGNGFASHQTAQLPELRTYFGIRFRHGEHHHLNTKLFQLRYGLGRSHRRCHHQIGL